MKILARLVLILSVPVLLALGFALVSSWWTAERGWNLSDLRLQLVAVYQRRSEVKFQIGIAKRRSEARQRIIQEVIEGRETLLGAAASLRAIDTNPSDFPPEYPKFFPGGSEGERLCREVIIRVTNALQDTAPDQVRSQTARLEAELQEHLREHHGVVVLPEE
jgi:hypothetical protein